MVHANVFPLLWEPETKAKHRLVNGLHLTSPWSGNSSFADGQQTGGVSQSCIDALCTSAGGTAQC